MIAVYGVGDLTSKVVVITHHQLRGYGEGIFFLYQNRLHIDGSEGLI